MAHPSRAALICVAATVFGSACLAVDNRGGRGRSGLQLDRLDDRDGAGLQRAGTPLLHREMEQS